MKLLPRVLAMFAPVAARSPSCPRFSSQICTRSRDASRLWTSFCCSPDQGGTPLLYNPACCGKQSFCSPEWGGIILFCHPKRRGQTAFFGPAYCGKASFCCGKFCFVNQPGVEKCILWLSILWKNLVLQPSRLWKNFVLKPRMVWENFVLLPRIVWKTCCSNQHGLGVFLIKKRLNSCLKKTYGCGSTWRCKLLAEICYS